MYSSACEAHCHCGSVAAVPTWRRQTSGPGAGAPPPTARADQTPVTGKQTPCKDQHKDTKLNMYIYMAYLNTCDTTLTHNAKKNLFS